MAPQPLWVVTGPQIVLALGGLDSFKEGVPQSVLPAASCHSSGLHVPGVRSHHTDTIFMSPRWVHPSGALLLCSWEGPSAQPDSRTGGSSPHSLIGSSYMYLESVCSGDLSLLLHLLTGPRTSGGRMRGCVFCTCVTL